MKAVQHTSHNLVLQEKINVGMLRAVHRMFATIAKPSNRNAQEA
jgi:hypothetical protein